MYSFVVAVGKNNEIGINNRLPWHLPNDMKFFKNITMGKPMIMGRKTFESLPKVLPGRDHIVLTRDKNYKVDHPRVTIVNSLEELLELTKEDREYAVIGGSEIFKLMLPYVEKIYLTRIDKAFDADTFLNIGNEEQWQIIEEIQGILDEKNTIPHKFLTLVRK